MRKIKKPRKPLPAHVREASAKASKGNSWWEQRSKHGRDVLFKEPQLLWEAASEYFKWCDEHPWYRSENKVVSKGGAFGSEVELHKEPVRIPYTYHGLCLYLDCGLSYFRNFKITDTYKKNKGFQAVIEHIDQTIFSQQFNGAAAGFFNANIISRALGLVEKQDVTTGGEKLQAPPINCYMQAPPLSGSEDEVEKLETKTKKK